MEGGKKHRKGGEGRTAVAVRNQERAVGEKKGRKEKKRGKRGGGPRTAPEIRTTGSIFKCKRYSVGEEGK